MFTFFKRIVEEEDVEEEERVYLDDEKLSSLVERFVVVNYLPKIKTKKTTS